MWPLLPALSHPILPYPTLSHLPWHRVVSCRFMSYSVMSCNVPPFGSASVPVAVHGTQNTYLIAIFFYAFLYYICCATKAVIGARRGVVDAQPSPVGSGGGRQTGHGGGPRSAKRDRKVCGTVETLLLLYCLCVCNTPLFQPLIFFRSKLEKLSLACIDANV